MNEIRIVEDSQFSVRSENGNNTIQGIAAVFNQESRLIAENGKIFFEIIMPNAFDEVLQNPDLNVIANRDHDNMKMLARTKSGTLALTIEDVGLIYTFEPPKTALGDETVELLNRGDLRESSFRYRVKHSDVKWYYGSDGILRRQINKISEILDVAIVVNGAFANTDVAVRGLDIDAVEEHLRNEELKRQEALDAYYKQLKQGFL